jgi:protein ImuB
MVMTVPSASRYLFLWLPLLPIDRLRRGSRPIVPPDERPLVVVAKEKSALRLTAVDPRAARLGLKPGMALTDARAMIIDLNVAEADVAADAALCEAVADWCDRFTPLVACDGPDGLMLDISGCAHLFGGEQALGRDLIRRLLAQGIHTRAAIASTPAAARAVARFGAGGIVPAGGEAAALMPLPVAALGLAGEVVHGLERMGLFTIADLETRARAPLAARFGQALLLALDRALGRLEEPITPRRPPPALIAERRFPEPLAETTAVRCVLQGLAADLAGMLERRGEGARDYEASFFRADGALRRIRIETGRPLRDPATIDRLFALKLDALADPIDPGFGFDMIRLAVGATDRLDTRQESLNREDLQAGMAEEGREALLGDLADRLSARLGAGRVRRFVTRDTHIPERAAGTLPALHVPGRQDWPTGTAIPMRPLRLFDQPEPVEVIAQVPDGPPARFRWRRALHEVTKAEGPERIAGEWWISTRPTRDYFRVEDVAGRRFWLYRDGLYEREPGRPQWFLHGVFA